MIPSLTCTIEINSKTGVSRPCKTKCIGKNKIQFDNMKNSV